jgi:hypothetical protein
MTLSQISIVIPSFNSARYIGQTLDSVFNQDYPSFEVIVVDDGSTDETQQILASFQDRIRYVAQKNSGPSAARNHGLKLAGGDFVAFLDADDLLLPGKLSQQAAMLDQKPDLGYIHSGWHLIGPNGKWLNTVGPWDNAPRLDLQTWLLHSPVYMGSMLFRRAWIEKAGGFDPGLPQAEDVKLMLTLAQLGCTGAWQHQPTVCYRQHDHSITRNILQQTDCLTRVLDEFFTQPDLPQTIRSIENQVKYNNCLWCAWVLYSTGHHPQIAAYLRRSLQYVDTPPARTVQWWLGQLVLYCRDNPQCKPEELQVLWPYFKAAIQVSPAQWEQIERVLTMLMRAEMHKHTARENRATLKITT